MIMEDEDIERMEERRRKVEVSERERERERERTQVSAGWINVPKVCHCERLPRKQ